MDDGSSALGRGSLARAVTGSGDSVLPGDASALPSVSAALGRDEPSSAQWNDLLPKLQQAAKTHPGDIATQRKLAMAYYNLGRLSDARTIYEALLGTSEDAVLRTRLGNTLRDMGALVEAAAAYRKAIEDDPSLVPPYLNLAELLWRQGGEGEALAVIDGGLGAVPQDKRAQLAEARHMMADQKEAPTT